MIKLHIEAGQASPAPPVGPALGQHNVTIMDFVRLFNDRTGKMEPGTMVPVVISVYKDKHFTFVMKSPPAAYLVQKGGRNRQGLRRAEQGKSGQGDPSPSGRDRQGKNGGSERL